MARIRALALSGSWTISNRPGSTLASPATFRMDLSSPDQLLPDGPAHGLDGVGILRDGDRQPLGRGALDPFDDLIECGDHESPFSPAPAEG
jgi:hypothetical protein